MDPLSREWRSSVQYGPGDRVAFKITGSLGVAAFECLQFHVSTSDNQAVTHIGNIIQKDFHGVDEFTNHVLEIV